MTRDAWLACAALLVPSVEVRAQLWDNPEYILWIDGPCGQTIEGVAGSPLDDGTGGGPEFEKGRAGVDFDIVLFQGQIPHQFGETQAWRWAAGVEGPLTITDVTLKGTVSCESLYGPPCLGRGIDGWTELTGLPYGGGPQTPENHGALSVFWLGREGQLPHEVADFVIAKVRVTGEFPETEGETVTGRLLFAARTGAAGGPIEPGVTYNGAVVSTALGYPRLQLLDCALVLKAVGPIDSFVRCDVTDDGVVDISDPIRVLGELFVGDAAPIGCPAAGDCNADGVRDISDAIYGLSYLFLGSPAPPSPFPECGRPEGTTEEDCPGATTRCP